MTKDIIDPKIQWCELCQKAVKEVDPAKAKGFRYWIMVCPECRKEFPDRQKMEWGKEQYKYYWDLGATPVIPVTPYSKENRHWYEIEATKQQIVWLRAAGYQVISTGKEAKK